MDYLDGFSRLSETPTNRKNPFLYLVARQI